MSFVSSFPNLNWLNPGKAVLLLPMLTVSRLFESLTDTDRHAADDDILTSIISGRGRKTSEAAARRRAAR